MAVISPLKTVHTQQGVQKFQGQGAKKVQDQSLPRETFFHFTGAYLDRFEFELFAVTQQLGDFQHPVQNMPVCTENLGLERIEKVIACAGFGAGGSHHLF